MSAVPKHVNSYDRDAPTPAIGSRWIWEPGKPYARENIMVTDVKWNGEEWWVRAKVAYRTTPWGTKYGVVPGESYWNDLSRFWEAVTPVAAQRGTS